MMYHTKKLYYSDPFLLQCDAEIVEIRNGNEICLDQTVAYPEGGGQVSDIGTFFIDDLCIPFFDVKKGYGRVFSVKDFPTVNVDTPVYHTVSEDAISVFSVGQRIKMKIDVKRRIGATIHHSALHLALMVVSEIRGDLYSKIKGCSITDINARVDFSLLEKFSENELSVLNENLNNLIAESVPVVVFPYEGEKEAWFWKCKDYICPCGGTHITNTSQVGHITAKRKGIGKGAERLIVIVDNPVLSEKYYHYMTE